MADDISAVLQRMARMESELAQLAASSAPVAGSSQTSSSSARYKDDSTSSIQTLPQAVQQIAQLQENIYALKQENDKQLQELQSLRSDMHNSRIRNSPHSGASSTSQLELPLSSQRRTVRHPHPSHYGKPHYTAYFPLELTDKDYFRRILDITACGLRERLQQIWKGQAQFLGFDTLASGHALGTGALFASSSRTKPSSSSNSSVPSSTYNPATISAAISAITQDPNSLLDLLAGKGLDATQRSTLHDLLASTLNITTSSLLDSVGGLCQWREWFLQRGELSRLLIAGDVEGGGTEPHSPHSELDHDASPSSPTITPFDLALRLLDCFIHAEGGRAGYSGGAVSIAIYEIKELHKQAILHRKYKDARLVAVGWKWGLEERNRGKVHNNVEENQDAFVVDRTALAHKSTDTLMHSGTRPQTGNKPSSTALKTDYLVASRRDSAANVMRRVDQRRRRSSAGAGMEAAAAVAASMSAVDQSESAWDNGSSSDQEESLFAALTRVLGSITVTDVDADIHAAFTSLASIKAKLEINISSTASPITQLCVRLASWLELLENAADRCLEGGDVVEGERLQNLAFAVGAPMEAPLPSPSSLQVGLQTDGRHRKTMFASSSADGASLGLDIDMLGMGSSLGYREQFGAHSMESESGWDRLERLQKLLSSCTEVVNTARTLAETAAAQHHFQVEDTLLASVAIIAPAYKKLTALMLTCHPLTKELALELSQPLHGGTAVLTSDLIFCIPCPEDGTCIGSLVVKVAYTPLLRMIYRTWPDLSFAVQRTSYEEAEVAVAMGGAHIFGATLSSSKAAHAMQTSLDVIASHHTDLSAAASQDPFAALLQGEDYLANTYHLTRADTVRVLAVDLDAQLDFLNGIITAGGDKIVSMSQSGASGGSITGGIMVQSGKHGSGTIDWSSPFSLRVKLSLPLAILRRTGLFTDDALLSAGYRALELQGQGFGAAALRKGGYSAGHCHALGHSVIQLLQQGYPPASIVQTGGYTYSELRACNVDIQRHVLMGLFDALDGRRWKKKTNWGTTRPLNEWFGVVLNGWGDVVKVDLRGNGLTGQLPACLPLLAQLEYLDLFNNNITGRLEEWMCQLSNLRDLWLTGNPIEVSALIKSQLRARIPQLKFRL